MLKSSLRHFFIYLAVTGLIFSLATATMGAVSIQNHEEEVFQREKPNAIFIRENRAEDLGHPEYGKHKLPEHPGSEEIMGLRTEYSRTFKKADGSFATTQSYVPLHTLKDGIWITKEGEKPSNSGTYTAGDISTDLGFQNNINGNSSCPGLMSITITPEAIITGVNVAYSMTAENNGYKSEQRSQLRCTNPGGTREGSNNPGTGGTGGTQNYSRPNLTVANNVTGGGQINFELHAGRTWGGSGCNTTYNKVDNNTWTITVHYLVPNTYYSYQSGNWDVATNWTTDPSGTNLTDPGVPGAADRAVILNGREITVTASNKNTEYLEIRKGGILNLNTTTGHKFNTMLGSGYMKLSSGTLPLGNMDAFVSESGGTIEYYGSGNFTFDRNTFNNLIINLNATATTASVNAAFLINGDLTIERGTFIIGTGNTSRTIDANNNVVVKTQGRISIGGNSIEHHFNIGGDFDINGAVSFTTRNSADYLNNSGGRANVNFINATKHQSVQINADATFYRIGINKGVDDTYILNLDASNPAFFKIYGPNNNQTNTPATPAPNIPNNNAINLLAGTLRIGNNIEILSLGSSNGTGNTDMRLYSIDSDCQLWIDGGSISTTSYTNNNRLIAIAIYGKLRITEGQLNDISQQGLLLRNTGQLIIDGGVVSATVIRTSAESSGNHYGAYIQNGGIVTVRRDFGTANDGFSASFHLGYASTSFTMTDGILNILASTPTTSTGTEGRQFSFVLASEASNINVSGGEVNITIPANRDARIASRVPFNNLNFISSSSAQQARIMAFNGSDYSNAVPALPLIATGNLTIVGQAVLNTEGQNLFIGGNFTIENTATYTPGSNTTVFDGASTQVFANNGTITSGLNNLSIENKAIVSITQNLVIRNDLNIGAETILRDMSRSITVAGNISNSGTHESQANGAIILNKAGAQSINGSGEGVFGNLILNKTSGITTLTANTTITGNLRLAGTASLFDIGSNRISMAAGARIFDHLTNNTNTGFGSSKMIRTAGNASDGGLRIYYANIQERVYPLGTAIKYTPARISFTNPPTEYGSISVRPVNSSHPHKTSDDLLNYYWSVSSQGFSGIVANSLVQKFFYQEADLHTGANEALYVPAVYNPTFWQFYGTDDVAEVTNEIRFDKISSPDGDFTAGYSGAFGGVAAVFSRASGNWGGANTWTNDPVLNTPLSNYTPKPEDPVVIRAGHTVSLNLHNAEAGSLYLQEGGVLDVGTFTGHYFGKSYGKGTLRISSSTATAQFPAGDFGEFLGENGGTVVYYTTGTVDFTTPSLRILNETFSSGSPWPPAGWSRINGGTGTGQWIHSTTLGNTGGAAIINDVNSDQQNNDYLITPRLIPSSDNSTFSFDIRRRDANNGTYQVLLSTSGTDQSDFNITLVASGSSTSTWVTVNLDLSSYIGTPISIAIVSNSRRGSRVDNVRGIPLFIEAQSPSTYHHLVLEPGNGRTITLGTENIRVFGNFTTRGAGIAQFNPNTGIRVDVDGNMFVTETSRLQYPNGVAATLSVKGNTEVSSSNGISVLNANTAVENRLILQGNIINTGSINLMGGTTRYADVYFTGTAHQTLSGTGSNNFNRVYLQKGSSQEALLDVTSNSFGVNLTHGAPLSIAGGSIRFSGAGLTTTLSNTTMSIPSIGALIVNGSTITLAANNSNDANLFLAGKLQVNAGTLNIGNPANNVRNDIEYPGAGRSEIVVNGGTLRVNGQIRRNISLTTGALTYRQSGGSVIISGKQRQNGRALLEIINPGSRFEMSGGEITLVNGLATVTARQFGELYLNAEFHEVSGGTITLGNASTAANNFFDLYLANPVWNLTVDGQTNAKTARLRTFPATINNDLNINGPTASELRAEGLNLNIGGDFISSSGSTANSFRRGTDSQKTTFFGTKSNRTIRHSGVSSGLHFGQMTIDVGSNNTVTFSDGEIWINGIAEFLSGTIVQINNNFIGLYDDAYLSDVPSWTSNGRTLAFRSTTTPKQQNIYSDGKGEFGLIQIRNPLGVVLNGDLKIAQGLNFHTGLFIIGHNLLTLSTTSTISGTIDNTRMIVTNGALSDAGVTKEYSGNGNFTFSIGVAGKYTPATLNVTNAGGAPGSITVKPINSFHPTTALPQGDELQYYWNVKSSGFNNPTVSHTYRHAQTEADGSFVNGRYHNYLWNSPLGTYSSANKTITINNANYIDGEYTAGLAANFSNKSILYSRGNLSWFDTNAWSTTPGGSACNCTPNGNPVVIQSGHTITVGSNSAFAYSVTIQGNAKLNLGKTIMHNMGHISGDGTMAITATDAGSFILPGGDYSPFMNSLLSTIEYSGTGTLPANILTYSNVKFLGTGTVKKIPSINILVRGNLSIEGGVLDNTAFNGEITVGGNWNNSVKDGFLAGKGMVTFIGSSSVLASTFGERFYNLRINASGATLTLNSPVNVERYLYLTRGHIFTTATNLLTLDWISNNAVVESSNTSFVQGPVRKLIPSGQSFIFPVGDTNAEASKRFGSVRIFGTITTGNQYWTAQYHYAEPIDRLALNAPLQAVSTNEYWSVSGPENGLANIRLRWDALSEPLPSTALGRQKMRVARYMTNRWTGVGQNVSDYGLTNGYIQTAGTIAFSTSASLFTLGLDETATAQIRGTLGDIDEICDTPGSTMSVIVEFTGNGPYSLVYSINNAIQPTLTNLTNPYHITFSYEQLHNINGVGSYTIRLHEVYDVNNMEGVIISGDAQLTLLATPNQVVTGPNRAAIGSSSIFTVPNLADNTYVWSVSGLATSVSGNTSPSFTVNWGNTTGTATITITQTNQITGCSRTVTHTVDVVNWPVILGPLDVCAGATATYNTNAQSGHTYNWTVTGGTINSGAGTSHISVTWSSAASGQIQLSQGPSGSMVSTSEIITIHTAPLERNLLTPPICAGSVAQITLESSQSNVSYQLRLTNNTNVGAPLTGNGSNIILQSGILAANTDFLVAAYNPGCEITMNASVEVRPNNGEFYWSGAASTNWFESNNWACGGTPTITSDVLITGKAIRQPLISNGGVSAFTHNFTITDNQALNLASGAKLEVSGNVNIVGTLNLNQSTVVFSGTELQEINTSFPLEFFNLEVNKTSQEVRFYRNTFVLNSLKLDGIVSINSAAFLRLGNNSVDGSLSGTSGLIKGEFQRWIGTTAKYNLPIGTSTGLKTVSIKFNELPSRGILSVSFGETMPFPTEQLYANLPFFEGELLLDNISHSGVWHVNPVQGLDNSASYNISFLTQGIPGILIPANLRMLKRPSNGAGGWQIPGTHGGVITHDAGTSNYEVSRTNVTGFSIYALAGSLSENPLPVELLYFTANNAGEKVALNWATASEINNAFFTVERSLDNKAFEGIAMLPSHSENGYSNQMLGYQSFDENPPQGIVYYRLKQTDYDGKYEYSNTIAVQRLAQTQIQCLLFPNPNRGDAFNLLANGFEPETNIQIRIVDLFGKTIFTENLLSDKEGTLIHQLTPQSTLPKGVYLIQIIGTQQQQAIRMVIK